MFLIMKILLITYITILLLYVAKGDLNVLLNIEDKIKQTTGQLASYILKNYMSHFRCLVIVSDENYLENIQFVQGMTLFRISPNFNDECQDEETFHILSLIFFEQCEGYIIQIENPKCFLKMWAKVALESLHRHAPRLFILPETNNSNVLDVFLIREAEQSSEILVAEFQTNLSTSICFHLWTNNFYKPVSFETPAHSGNLNGIWLDTWCEETEFSSQLQLFPDKVANLQGKELRLFTWTYPPYAILKPFDGTEARIAMEFCRLYNCSYVVNTDSYMWGEIFDNETGGNGPVGAVYSDRADIGFSGLYLWEREHNYLDYSTPYLYSSVTCMVPKPLLLPGWWLPILPFSKNIWTALIISVIIAAVTLYVIAKATRKFTRLGAQLRRTSQFTTFTDTFLRVIGLTVLQTPPTRLITDAPYRHLFTWYEILFLLLTSCYAGGLSSFLTLPLSYPAVDTIEQLVKSNMPWAADHEAWIYSLLHSSDENIKTLIKRFEVHTHDELTLLALGGEYAISIERLPGGHMCEEKHMTVDAISKRHMMKEALYGSPIVMVLRKGSPYNARLNALIHKILDHGLLLFWERDVSRRYLSSRVQIAVEQSASSSHETSQLTSLKFTHIQGAFILLATGLMGAFISFLLEIYLNRKMKRKQQDTHLK